MALKLIALCSLLAAALAVPAPKVIDPELDWKIVGGSNADTGQFPHIVSLRYFGSHICGGSIINENYILTAAHCVEDGSTSGITVVAGSNHLNSGGDSYDVESITVHPDWDNQQIVNDIALLRTATPIVMSDLVKAIPIELQYVDGGEDVVLSGWGTTSYPGSIPNNLQFINLKTITTIICQAQQTPNPIYDTQVCTLTQEGEGACHGDSGGPLIRYGQLIGIVSWGRPCGLGYPDVYTRVSSYSGWINNNMS